MSAEAFFQLFGVTGAAIVDEAGLLERTNGTGEHVHMVLRVTDEIKLPPPYLVARRIKVRCKECRALCWYDPESALLASRAEILCIQCVLARAARETSGDPQ